MPSEGAWGQGWLEGSAKPAVGSPRESGHQARGHEWTCASQPATGSPGPPTPVAGSERPLIGRPAQALRPTQGHAGVFLWVPCAGVPPA